MKTTIHVDMKPVNTILARIGVDKTGDVQMEVTKNINRRIARYMPFRTGALSMKSKFIRSSTEIEVAANYARYQYYGKVMVGKAPKVATDKNLNYDKTKNQNAGPFWDRRMMAAEGAQIEADIQEYVNRRTNR